MTSPDSCLKWCNLFSWVEWNILDRKKVHHQFFFQNFLPIKLAAIHLRFQRFTFPSFLKLWSWMEIHLRWTDVLATRLQVWSYSLTLLLKTNMIPQMDNRKWTSTKKIWLVSQFTFEVPQRWLSNFQYKATLFWTLYVE